MTYNPITISQPDMQHDYYDINPPKHAEKAYQPRRDKVPPFATIPSTSATGEFVAMMTTIYNNPPFGVAQMELVDYDSLIRFNGGAFPTNEEANQIIASHPEIVCARLSGTTPFVVKVNCAANDSLTLRPLTPGYMSKVISKKDYDGGGGRPSL
ncbi:MAG: hypothetical protein JOZ52_09125 [Acidobacteria bacterium]|nr:hypothetical protein [Acidobacteriota bacterium]